MFAFTRLLLPMMLVFCGPAAVAAESAMDLQSRFGHYYASTVVNIDGTSIESHEWSQTVLKETALDNVKHASVGYSTSAQKAEVIAAYTLKADGRKIEVPKDNYQIEVNKGKGKDSPVYSDWTTMTVIFPDVAVGDSVVLSYKLTHLEPMFPEHYSAAQLFYRDVAYDDVRVRFDYPAAMPMQYEGRGMKETTNTTEGDRKIVEWSYANPRPQRSERRDFSVFDPDQEVGYAVSTFKTYAEVAAAYGARAQAKATVTERIEKLATEIAGTQPTNRKQQARMLYEWVAKNITYAGNCIGVGAVVPRDLPFVLDNRMGDCKDHATLLQALLAARGIKSTQALVNAGSVYRLQRIPSVFSVNHVINYLPELDLFVDSTSESTPFGMLPYNDQDKPVLLVEGLKESMKTPTQTPDSNRQQTRSVLKIASDGSVSGSVDVQQAGFGAVRMRAWARQISRDVETDLVKNAFRKQGVIGSGQFEKDDPTALTDTYRYKATFKAEKFIKAPGAGAFYVFPPLSIAPSILTVAQSSMEPETESDATCTGGSLVEDYTIELPKSVKVLSAPKNLKISTPQVSYNASYKVKGNVLTVKRTLDDRTKGNVCSPQVLAEYRKVAERVMDNLKEQVLYK